MRTEIETKHTPGPWTIAENTTDLLIQGVDGLHIIGERKRYGCCQCSPANARLIAAAPDLLEICQTVLLRLDLEHAERIDKGEERPVFLCGAMRDDLRAALAKAKGTQ